jgi:4-amino-4-deoxy-L-arabinose transferase-like glycosyltransferase
MTKKWQITFDVLFILALGAAFFGAFLGSYHFITPDEGRYPEVAREMLMSRHFITPHLNGIAFLDKPILYYWLEAAMMHLFGVTEWSVRLVPAFFGLLGGVLVYWAGYELYCRKTAILAAVLLMTSLLYFFSAHYADMDLMVVVLLSGALWLFIMGIQYPMGRRRRAYLWGAYAFAAFAFLTKGMMGLVFPGMIILVWMLLLNEWKVLAKMYIPTGLLLFFCIIFPWLIVVQHKNSEFFYYFFVVQQFSRFVSKHFNMQQSVFYYIPVILLGFMPWTVFLFQALIAKVRWMSAHWKQSRTELFIFLWPLLIFIFFSIPHSKIVGYIVPVFPPLALIVANYLTVRWKQLPGSRGLKIASVLYFIFAILVVIAIIVAAHLPKLVTQGSFAFLCALSVIIFSGALLTMILSFVQKRFKLTFMAMLLTTIVFSVVAVASFSTYQLKTVKPLAMRINHIIKPGDIVVAYNKYYQDLPLYIHKKIYVVGNWHTSALITHDNWRRELGEDIIYKHIHAPWLINEYDFRRLWKGKQRVFALTSPGRARHLKASVKQPVYQLENYQGTVLLSNRR